MSALDRVFSTDNKMQRHIELAFEQLPEIPIRANLLAQRLDVPPGVDSVRQTSSLQPLALQDHADGPFPVFQTGPGPVRNWTSDGKAYQIRRKRGDVAYDPSLPMKDANAAFRMIAVAPDIAIFNILNQLGTLTYSDGTGSPNIIDDNSPAHTLSDGTTTQRNNVAAAFSEVSLNSALVLGRNWKNFADAEPVGYFDGPVILVGSESLRLTMHKTTRGVTLPIVVDSNVGDTTNMLAQLHQYSIATSPRFTSASNWLAIDAQHTPLWWAWTVPPMVTSNFDPDTHEWVTSVDAEIIAGCNVPPAGLVGSVV